MNGIAVLVTLAAIGVDYGWQPLPDGQLEYIIQIEPTLLDGMKSGEEIVSEIPPQARGVRKFRIRVGTAALPRVGHMESSTAPRSLNTSGASSVLPPQNDRGPLSTPAASSRFGAEFGPDGFLNLPPPPALLGPDGKNSVLVRPGSESNERAVLPPRVADNPPASYDSTTLDLTPPPAAGGYSGGGWQSPGISKPGNFGTGAGGSDNPLPPGGGVFPPPTSVESSGPDAGDMVLPPADNETTPPANTRPIRPVPSPSSDSEPPAPIRFGASGVKAPERNRDAVAGPAGPNSSTSSRNDLVAQLAEADATALQKPAIDEETAEQLQAKPWTPLVLTSLALFASLAANLYLGWVAVGIYRRYRDMVDQLHQAQASLT